MTAQQHDAAVSCHFLSCCGHVPTEQNPSWHAQTCTSRFSAQQVGAAQQYNTSASGYGPLRQWAEHHVQRMHSPPSPHDVIITSGSNHAADVSSSECLGAKQCAVCTAVHWPSCQWRMLFVVGKPADLECAPELLQKACQAVSCVSTC